jgi:hypothetical protein
MFQSREIEMIDWLQTGPVTTTADVAPASALIPRANRLGKMIETPNTDRSLTVLAAATVLPSAAKIKTPRNIKLLARHFDSDQSSAVKQSLCVLSGFARIW